MAGLEPDEGNVPWGKYTYALEGLATGCYMEGTASDPPQSPSAASPDRPQRLRFRIELPARCFILSLAVKLPNAPTETLAALEDLLVERTLANADYEPVFNARAEKQAITSPQPPTSAELKKNSGSEDPLNDSPTSVEHTSAVTELPRKRVVEIRRAADSLRLTIPDIDGPNPNLSSSENSDEDEDDDASNASDHIDFRTLGIVVVGYIRGQTPASNRIKILLNSSARLGVAVAKPDRAEVDGLLGLAFLGNRRYRQAAELLQRSSELITEVAATDSKAGFSIEDATLWAAELNLLAAYAYFEHVPMCNDGIIRLVQVATVAPTVHHLPRSSQLPLRDAEELAAGFLDMRTELLNMLENLVAMLVKFLAESNSPAVRMAACRMIEFISEQLGCGMARHMSTILNQVLRTYPSCTAFGARERAAAASFSYDSMEDCCEHLVDLCCRMFPLTEHGVLQNLYDNTLIPVFLDAFHEPQYLRPESDGEPEDEAHALMCTAVAQTLRVIFLVLNVLGADARVPTSLITRILNILVLENGQYRTPIILRRTALHSWDALARALTQAASGSSVKSFEEHLNVLASFIPRLLIEVPRPGFEYAELEEEDAPPVTVVKEDLVAGGHNELFAELLQKRNSRTEIVDRHTLKRLLALIKEICIALEATGDDDVHSEVIFTLQEVIGEAIGNLLLSSLLDVSYHEAVVSGIGGQENQSPFEFGNIETQLEIVGEVFEELFDCYWAALSLIPPRMAEEAAKCAPIRTVLGWCIDRLGYSAPPQGMLRLTCVVIRGLQHELDVCMYDSSNSSDITNVTFLKLYRAHLRWFSQSAHEEAFDLIDMLTPIVAKNLLADDLLLLIRAVGDQTEDYQPRTETCMESLSQIVATTSPKDNEAALKSLRHHKDKTIGKRLREGFPKSSAGRSSTGSFTKKALMASASPRNEPMIKSFYVHVVLSSCFDRFDSLAQAAEQKAGPSFMGERIDSFVEHAAFAVRCLHACARSRRHREYVGAILGDVFGTCLAMEDHSDGRVRLAGFEIFAAALDVLFLAQKSSKLGTQAVGFETTQPEGNVFTTAPDGIATPVGTEPVNGVTELALPGEDDSTTLSASTPSNRLSGSELTRSLSINSLSSPKGALNGDEKNNVLDPDEDDAEGERRMSHIFSDGGTWLFQAEQLPLTDLAFEERAWQMLCLFLSSSLAVGKYVDLLVQRASLEYLRGCLFNALRGHSTGASVISFEHIEAMWDSVSRLVGSPWRALNSLAMWVICAIVNVSVYATVMAKGKGASRLRITNFSDFATGRVFKRVETLLKSTSRENRVWGMRLLEVYVRARDLNMPVVSNLPVPPGRILRSLQTLKNDWNEDVRERGQSLLEIHYNSINRKQGGSQLNSFSMYMKRNNLEDPDASVSSRLELWFPPIPKQDPRVDMKKYTCTLESFANLEIEGGEEVELCRAPEPEDDDEGGDYDYDDEPDDEGDEGEFELAGPHEEEPLHGEEQEEQEESDEESDTGEEDHHSNDEEEQDPLINTSERKEDKDPRPNAEAGDDEEVPTSGPGQDVNPSTLFASGSDDTDDGMDDDGDLNSNEDDNRSEDDLSNEEDMKDGAHDDDEDDEEDVEDDHEFSELGQSNPDSVESSDSTTTDEEPVLSLPSSDVKHSTNVDEFGATPVNSISITDDDNDVEEEILDDDDVVLVTDDEDLFGDLDDLPEPEPTATKPSRTDSWIKSASSGAELNPDLDEKVQVIRRVGSFTGRSQSGFSVEEGMAPKLIRRRSKMMGVMSSDHLDGEDGSSPRVAQRLSRRKSVAKSPVSSPRGGEFIRNRSSDLFTMTEDSNLEDDERTSQKMVRRKSSRQHAGSDEADFKTSRNNFATGDSSNNTSQYSPRMQRAMRSFGKGEEEEDDGVEVRPPPLNRDRDGSLSKLRTSAANESGAGARPPASTRRSLPRARAFVKGGLQRKNSADEESLPEKSGVASSRPGGASSLNAGGTSAAQTNGTSGSSSQPSLAMSRGRVPRGKSSAGRAVRSSSAEVDSTDKRAHRYGRRGGLNLKLDLSDSDALEKQLLSESDGANSKNIGNNGNNSKVRAGTPTAEGAIGKNLGDDPVYRRKGSKRSVAESPHFKEMVDGGVWGGVGKEKERMFSGDAGNSKSRPGQVGRGETKTENSAESKTENKSDSNKVDATGTEDSVDNNETLSVADRIKLLSRRVSSDGDKPE